MDVLPDQVPTLFYCMFRACQIDVINVHTQHELELFVPETGRPSFYWFEPRLNEELVAVFFPVAAAVGMSINGFSETYHRSAEASVGPAIGASLWRDIYPRFCSC